MAVHYLHNYFIKCIQCDQMVNLAYKFLAISSNEN